MYCNKCKVKTKVINTAAEEDVVYRERKCPACGDSWYTEERTGNQRKIAKEIALLRSKIR